MTAPSQTPPAPIASRAATPTPSHRSYGYPPTTPPLPELSSNYSSSRSSTTSPTRSNNSHQSHFPIMQTQTGSKSSTSLRLTPDSHAHRSHPTSPSAPEQRIFWHPPKLGMRSGQDSDHWYALTLSLFSQCLLSSDLPLTTFRSCFDFAFSLQRHLFMTAFSWPDVIYLPHLIHFFFLSFRHYLGKLSYQEFSGFWR